MQDKEIQELIEKIKKYANDVDVSLVEGLLLWKKST